MMESRGLSVGVVAEAWVLGLTSLAISVAFLTFNIRMRHARIIKMSSPNLNVLIALGGIFISITCVLFGLDFFLAENISAVSRVCQIRSGILLLSTSLVFGPMFAKAWRVHRIFQQAATRRVVIRDKKLFVMTSCLLLLDVTLVAVWQGIDPLQYRTSVMFKHSIQGGSLEITGSDIVHVRSCSSDNSDMWMAGIFTFKTILLLYGLYLSWQTRNIMLPSMNDARSIIMTALTTVTMATFATSVAMMLQAWPNAVYACVIFSIWLSNMMAMCSVFVPKVILWWKNPDNSNFRVSLKSDHKLNNGLQSFEQLEEELYHVVTENLTLKKSLQEKDTTIKELQQHLTSARDKLLQITEEQVKQDSGLDIDLSSSGQEEDSTMTPHDEDISSIHGDSYYPIHHHPSPDIHYRSHISSGHSSAGSVASLSKLYQLKNSLVEDISQANTISANLRDSLSKDLDQLGKRRSWIYDSVRSRHELAGSIAKSYNLDDNGDTYSYVSSYLPSSCSVFNLDPACRKHRHYGSAESLATLANDRLYPSVTEQRREARRKLRHGSSHKDKVYTIQNTPRPEYVQNVVSCNKQSNGDTFV
ncbi:gamma-aminobutyric acid type B receptor subunit 2-like [Haliotis rubra]|uniref:gamma-aminobutyric acid type B receptor subunit 2-like n=1 Tax=Haliotis rubra TaxID=36100 RepID=UPI001EE52673|nr:gamma-aminobutyric acid type B receptor subunit 2-like [Haliotis rubra]